jgi:imidazoleglycerol-phosphate dehydratase
MRSATVSRKTAETDIRAELSLDGEGIFVEEYPIRFLSHMLAQVVKHGGLNLTLNAKGDTEIDSHHTAEDTGIVLGMVLKEALGDKSGIARYGSAIIPMDESLVLCAVDLSGRPYLHFDLPLNASMLGDLEADMVGEFFRALAVNAGIGLHIKFMHGQNAHHIAEAAFKAFGRALRQAASPDNRITGVPSTKGII